MLVTASTRVDIGNYVNAVFIVYIILILVYVLATLLFSFGLRPSYSRWIDAVMDFLRDVSDPYLRLFRKFIPSVGGIDFSPTVGIIVLYILKSVIVKAIQG